MKVYSNRSAYDNDGESIELNDRHQMVYIAINEVDGRVSVQATRRFLEDHGEEWGENASRIINDKFDHLEEHGLIEVEKEGEHKTAPKLASMTRLGAQKFDELTPSNPFGATTRTDVLERDLEAAEERIAELEEEVVEVRDHNDAQDDALFQLEDRVEQNESRVSTLEGNVSALRETVHKWFDGFFASFREVGVEPTQFVEDESSESVSADD